MAVKLRLRRMGKKRQPVYKVVAADARAPRDGRIIEAIGLYNPKTEPTTLEIAEDRAMYWLGVGAQPTTTVKNLLSSLGIIYKRELVKKGLSEEEIAAKMAEWNEKAEAKRAEKMEKAEKAAAKKEVKKEEPKQEEQEQKEEPKAEEKVEEPAAPEAEGTASDEGEAEEEEKKD